MSEWAPLVPTCKASPILCWVSFQTRLQSQDFGKHLHGVDDLLQIHGLVEADIAVQAERVKAIGAAAQRFATPGEGNALCQEGGSVVLL